MKLKVPVNMVFEVDAEAARQIAEQFAEWLERSGWRIELTSDPVHRLDKEASYADLAEAFVTDCMDKGVI